MKWRGCRWWFGGEWKSQDRQSGDHECDERYGYRQLFCEQLHGRYGLGEEFVGGMRKSDVIVTFVERK